MFDYSPFKREILSNKVPDSDAEGVGTYCTVYRCGNLADLCRGPHIHDTGKAAGFQVWKSSSSYWKGDKDNAALQRVYGISFPDKKMLEEWRKQQEALEAKSHTAIGTKQQLFFVEPQVRDLFVFDWRCFNTCCSSILQDPLFGFLTVLAFTTA